MTEPEIETQESPAEEVGPELTPQRAWDERRAERKRAAAETIKANAKAAVKQRDKVVGKARQHDDGGLTAKAKKVQKAMDERRKARAEASK